MCPEQILWSDIMAQLNMHTVQQSRHNAMRSICTTGEAIMSQRKHHYHHQVTLTAPSSLTLSLFLSRNPSLSSIVPGRSFRLHPVPV